MDTSRDQVQVNIRMPRQLAEALRRLAEEHDRTLQGEIVRVLRSWVRQQGTLPHTPPERQ